MTSEQLARTLVAKMELMSHGTVQAWDHLPHGTEEPGGAKPPGGPHGADDREPDFTLRSHVYFRRKLSRCTTASQFSALAAEALGAIDAWMHTPQPPKESKPWQEQVGAAGGSVREVAREWGISHQRVHQLRQQHRRKAARS